MQAELLSLQARLHKTIVLVTHDIDEAILLGDKVAILNVGGHLEQYDAPARILGSPANDFVADFLGSDRGIKRLSLIPISDVEFDRGPVVAPTDGRDLVDAQMASYDVDWVAVVADGNLMGWFSQDDLDRAGSVADVRLRRFETYLDVTASLKEALDAVVSSHTSVAAVFDGDEYRGMVTIDAISREIIT